MLGHAKKRRMKGSAWTEPESCVVVIKKNELERIPDILFHKISRLNVSRLCKNPPRAGRLFSLHHKTSEHNRGWVKTKISNQ